MECRLLPTGLVPWLGQGLDRVLMKLYRLLPTHVMNLGWSWLALCLQVGACALPVFFFFFGLSVRFLPDISLPPWELQYVDPK